MRRVLIASTPFFVAGCLLLSGVASRAERRDAGTGYELQNVEVMDPGMRLADARLFMVEFNDALGLQCRDCHDPKDFASDGRELKLAARDMMKMQREINARWFAEEAAPRVTCWTCHQGKLHPDAIAPDAPDGADGAPDGGPDEDESTAP